MSKIILSSETLGESLKKLKEVTFVHMEQDFNRILVKIKLFVRFLRGKINE